MDVILCSEQPHSQSSEGVWCLQGMTLRILSLYLSKDKKHCLSLMTFS